jgi:hypothetical protein
MACSVHAAIGAQWVETDCSFDSDGSFACDGYLCRPPHDDECSWGCDSSGACTTYCPDQVCTHIGHDAG